MYSLHTLPTLSSIGLLYHYQLIWNVFQLLLKGILWTLFHNKTLVLSHA